MKTPRIKWILGLLAVFSTLLGASLKVWNYSYANTFLCLGVLSLVGLLFTSLPKDDSFLDNWS